MAASPEPLYRRLTSGDPEGLDSIRTAVADARTSLADAAATTSSGALAAIRDWRGRSARSFAEKAQSSCATVWQRSRRLADVEAALAHAEVAYIVMARTAGATMGPWRNAQHLDDDLRDRLAAQTINALKSVRNSYDAQLGSAVSRLQGRDGWDSDGNADISGVNEGEPWTSQGLTYDGKNLLVTSYHDGDGDGHGDVDGLGEGQTQSRLTYVDHETGEEQGNVYLEDMPRPGGPPAQLGAPGPPSHSGGVATDGENVWVSSNGNVYIYDKSKLDRAANQSDPQPVQAENVVPVKAHSYVTYAEGKLFLGNYYENELYEYSVDDSGNPVDPKDPIPTPDNSQGVLVREDEFVFSSSNKLDGNLVTQDRDAIIPGLSRREIDLSGGDPGNEDGYDSHGNEELVEVDGEIIIAHESGAFGYGHNENSKDDEPELTRTPLEELGLDPDGALSAEEAGHEVSPSSLTTAARDFDAAASTLNGAARTLSGLQVVGHMLGKVPSAERFATAVTAHLTAAGQAVRGAAEDSADAAEGLVRSADSYRRVEDAARAAGERLGGLFG